MNLDHARVNPESSRINLEAMLWHWQVNAHPSGTSAQGMTGEGHRDTSQNQKPSLPSLVTCHQQGPWHLPLQAGHCLQSAMNKQCHRGTMVVCREASPAETLTLLPRNHHSSLQFPDLADPQPQLLGCVLPHANSQHGARTLLLTVNIWAQHFAEPGTKELYMKMLLSQGLERGLMATEVRAWLSMAR